MPPPPSSLEKLNAILHEEPCLTIAYWAFWSSFLLFAFPIAVGVLQVVTILKLILWLVGWDGANEYDPSRHPDKELAIVITGCDTGFGKNLAFLAADAGFVVFAGCLQKESLDQFPAKSSIHPVQMDVTSMKEVYLAVKKVKDWIETKKEKERFLHSIVCNAGIAILGDGDWLDFEAFERTLNVNFLGQVRCFKAFLPLLKAQRGTYGGSRILNMSSIAALVIGAPGMCAYGPSKFAVQAFSEYLRDELAPFGIQVSSINPSQHLTTLTDFERLKQNYANVPEEKRKQYGEEYLYAYKDLYETIPAWAPHMVANELLKCLKKKKCPQKVLVGTDARFFMILLRFLPGWALDLMSNATRPIPAIAK